MICERADKRDCIVLLHSVGGPLSLPSSGYGGFFLWGQSGRGVKLSTQVRPVPRSRVHRALNRNGIAGAVGVLTDVAQHLFLSAHQMAAPQASNSWAVRVTQASYTAVCVHRTRGPLTMAGSLLSLLLVSMLPAVHLLPPRVPIGEYRTMYQLSKLHEDGRLNWQDVCVASRRASVWCRHKAQWVNVRLSPVAACNLDSLPQESSFRTLRDPPEI
jgi:hypothetical protein